MPEKTARFNWILRLALVALVVGVVFLALAFTATVAVALWTALQGAQHWITVVMLSVLAGTELVLGFWLAVGYGVVKLVAANERAVDETAMRLGRLETFAHTQSDSLKKLTDLTSLSDQAKSLIFRDREIEALRETVREDLMRQDYRTAEALIDAMENKFGYADEAGRLREEVAASRRATLAEKIDAAVSRIQQMIDRRDWARAGRESSRLLRLFPDDPKVASLPERVERARSQHKRELLQAYGEAVRKDDLDRSIATLRELDSYLTPQEAAALAESARGVFKAKLHQLGVQFAIRITDQQWAEAVAVGDTIIKEFPNSRMAQEVRDRIDLLRMHASADAASPPAEQ